MQTSTPSPSPYYADAHIEVSHGRGGNRKSSNRASMPTVAAFVDELRAMGLTPKVVWASESGITVGKRPRDENVFDIPPGYRMATGTERAKK